MMMSALPRCFVASMAMLVLIPCYLSSVTAWITPAGFSIHHQSMNTPSVAKIGAGRLHCLYSDNEKNERTVNPDPTVSPSLQRRKFLWKPVVAATTTALALLQLDSYRSITNNHNPYVAHALVKGVAPPPKKSPNSDDRPKCTNVEECQELAERKEQREREEAQANAVPVSTTKRGTRYRDLQVGGSDNDKAVIAKPGDAVTLYYKVLKLGKRSYDGLSGEGTVVFSRGYGYEDDEANARSKSFVTTLGAVQNIAALNDAVPGMAVGGLRRFEIRPDQGWRKPGRQCDGGPGGSGQGGDLKTDYVVVPTATMVAAEACLDATKLPYPTTYAQQRRMAQRFDQSLILEVELVGVDPSGGFL